MNKNIYKAHLEELLRQLSDNNSLIDKDKKARILVGIDIQIEMCNLITNRYSKDYSNEKKFFRKVQEFILLDEFFKAIEYIKKELKYVINNYNMEALKNEVL